MLSQIIQKVVMITANAWHYLLFLFNNYKSSTPLKSDKPVIVYITDILQARAPRIIKWVARSEEFETILLYKTHQSNQFFFKEFDINQIPFKNNYELLRILSGIKNISLVHFFAPNSRLAFFLISKTNFKIIADYQDVVYSYYKNTPKHKWQQKEINNEIEVLQTADGIITHSLEPLAIFHDYKISKRPPILFFPLFTDNDFFVPEKSIHKMSGLHLVYAGAIAGKNSSDQETGNIKFFILAKSLACQQIHLHLYPSPYTSQEIINDYKELQEEFSTYFHLHDVVPQSQLVAEIAKYHFGIYTYFREFNNFDQYKFDYQTSLKTFNYLEAGLPILMSKDVKFMHWFFGRKNCIIDLEIKDLNNLKETIETKNYNVLFNNTLKAREELSLKNNISKIIDFYKKINET